MIGLAVAIPIAFFQTDGGWLTCLRVLAAVLVVQQIEGWFLTPKIISLACCAPPTCGPRFLSRPSVASHGAAGRSIT